LSREVGLSGDPGIFSQKIRLILYHRVEPLTREPCHIWQEVNVAQQTPLSQFDQSDLALIQAMAAGHAPALDELYARHGSAIFSFLMARTGDRPLAEEVVQDVMLAAWQGASGFRGESKVLTWLLTIARNRVINAQRRRDLPLVPYNDALDSPTDDTGPLEKVVKQAEQRAVRELLDKLPAHQREVLILVFYHQLSEVEVAEVLDIAVGTVKSRLFRGKEALRRGLQSEASF
jgi:RNA polymerase sigma factor (sigma-70 family)